MPRHYCWGWNATRNIRWSEKETNNWLAFFFFYFLKRFIKNFINSSWSRGNGLFNRLFHSFELLFFYLLAGEMIVGPTKTLFMDEISTGLDSSTTFQIVKCMQQIVHLTQATILMSLLQPDPETFNLFDDIILLSEGRVVYQGPRDHVVDFFESCGFKCPERKGTADFLQEVGR